MSNRVIRWVRGHVPCLLAMMLSCLAAVGHAQGIQHAHLQELLPRAQQNITALGADLAGDRVNLYNGALELVHADVVLPGNDALEVALRRKHVPGRDGYVRGELAGN